MRGEEGGDCSGTRYVRPLNHMSWYDKKDSPTLVVVSPWHSMGKCLSIRGDAFAILGKRERVFFFFIVIMQRSILFFPR